MKLFDDSIHAISGQAIAVVGYLNRIGPPDLPEDATIDMTPWYNGRERGYVITVRRSLFTPGIAIAFFEHRNTDSIAAVEFPVSTFLNPPTIDSIPSTHPYKGNKWSFDHSVPYGQASEMAEWIHGRIIDFIRKDLTE